MKKSLVKVFAVLHGLGCYLGSTVSYHDDEDDDDDASERLSYSNHRGYGSSVFCGTRRRHRRRQFSYTNSTEEEDLDDDIETSYSPSSVRNGYYTNNPSPSGGKNGYFNHNGLNLESPGTALRGCHIGNSKQHQHSPFQKRGCGHVNSHVTGMPELNQGVMLISMRHETKILTNEGQKTQSISPRPLVRLNKSQSGSNNTVNTVSSGYQSDEETRLEQTLASTMLQQILRDMYIEPELLAELDEEQKQILFCKMREEQVRRYHEREKKLEQEEKKKKRKSAKSGGKQVDFRLGSDKKEWVWVMGEHKDDKSIEEILEEEAQEKARLLAEQEAEELRKKEEEELQLKLKEEEKKLAEEEKRRKDEENKRKSAEAVAAAEEQRKKQEEERKQKYFALKKRHDYQRRKSVEEINRLKEKRSSEIYMSFREARQQIEQQAKDCSKKIEHDWEEQEKKAKKAEVERRAIARRAREEHRRSISTKGQVIGVFMNLNKETKEVQPPVPPRGYSGAHMRSARPTGRESIVEWFHEVEKLKGSGLDPQTDQVASWFHGIITRQDAEDLLEESQVGTFLVRVSERIWGYAISYRGPDRCKHFLIDTSDGSYQFFGTNQIAHTKLADLVNFHKSKPISGAGQELLLHPCPQKTDPPDYEDLFSGHEVESSYL